MGTAFLGTAFEAASGTGSWTNGRKHPSVRALFPMCETSFQIVTLRSTNIITLSQLAGKRVGVGPAGGPGEIFLKGWPRQQVCRFKRLRVRPLDQRRTCKRARLMRCGKAHCFPSLSSSRWLMRRMLSCSD